MHNKKVLNAIGNMTNVEKELNRQDLYAYKKFDNNQYALIPGHTHIKGVPDPLSTAKQASPVSKTGKANTLVNEGKIRKHEDRLQAYGLLNVSSGPSRRHNGDKTLERSLELSGGP